MTRENALRDAEQTVPWPDRADAQVIFIGRIRTPWTSRVDCPRQGRKDGPICRIEVFQPWDAALSGIDLYKEIEVLYWLHRSRRDLVLQSPADNGKARGTFSLRSPLRPNPIATSIVSLVGLEGSTLLVRGLDCLDETPLLDLKPDRCAFTPLAAPTKGDSDVDPTLPRP
jgi:tRNA-Thr(GGU) m(6)t(6)A37 methyltransferase TsaA